MCLLRQTATMHLAAWLERTGTTKAEFARRARCTWKLVHKVAAGHRPLVATAERFSAATNGEVSAAEILGVADVARAPEAAE